MAFFNFNPYRYYLLSLDICWKLKVVLNACRTSPSEFVIPYHKFLKAMDYNLAVGSRFRMKFESEESSGRRCDAFVLLLLVVLISSFCLPDGVPNE